VPDDKSVNVPDDESAKTRHKTPQSPPPPDHAELSSLMSVYGAIDQIVVDHPGLRHRVADLLPTYHNPEVVGWYDSYRAWVQAASRTQEERGIEQPMSVEFPTVAAGLNALSRIEAGALATRRLLGVAVLQRLLPWFIQSQERWTPDVVGHESLIDALVPIVSQEHPDGPEVGARQLLGLLGDAQTYPTIESFPALLHQAQQQALVSYAIAQQVLPSCKWTVVPATSIGGIAVAFEVHQRIKGFVFSDMAPILDPTKWDKDQPPWCHMNQVVPLGAAVVPNAQTFHEEVSLDCTTGLARIHTVLDFVGTPFPDNPGSVLVYRLHPNQRALGGDGLLNIDEGSVFIREKTSSSGSTLNVVTTKRVQFAPLVGMPSLAVAVVAEIVCHLGYASLAEHFFNMVVGSKVPGTYTHQFLNGSPEVVNAPPPAFAGTGPPSPGTGGSTSMLDQFVGALAASLGQCRSKANTSFTQLLAGQYGPGAYLGDVAKVSQHLVQQGAVFAKLGTQAMKSVGSTGTPGQ